VVGHDDRFVTGDGRKLFCQLFSPAFNHPAGVVELHLSIDDLTEEALAFLYATGDEIRPGLGVVISLKPNGASVMLSGSYLNARFLDRLSSFRPV
jgi:hypothetical protein